MTTSSTRPYPEAIRGAWFALPPNATRDDTPEFKQFDVLMCCMDNSFYQLQITRGVHVKQAHRGTYTFDGNFLITRTRTTETYRVNVIDDLEWEIETKRGPRRLVRALERASFELSEEELKTLKILPIKATSEPVVDHLATPYVLHFEDRPIALVSVDRWITQSTCWFGVLPFATNIPHTTWQRILIESIFPEVVQIPNDFSTIEVFFYDEKQLHHVDLLKEG